MSGVYIPGMEMPKSCDDCIFDTWGLCLINANLEGKDELTHSCPLAPVPPHGRLIDADNLYKQVTKFIGSPHWVAIEIKQAPTIIPASTADKEETE